MNNKNSNMKNNMNRQRNFLILLPFAVIFALILLGHAVDFSQYPSAAVDGAPWDKSWEMMAKAVGFETPGHGLTLQENTSVLAGDDTYYATWTIGEPTPYVNADGDDTDLYEAQLYVLLYGCAGAEDARAACEEFLAREQQSYDVQAWSTATHNAQEYTVIEYACGSETNPYSRGISAFAVCHNYVLVAELACLDSFSGDERQILSDFLDGCHYSADLA